MADTVDTGFGITIEFESGFIAEITDVTPPAPSRTAIDTSHTTTADGARTKIMGDLVDYGQCEVEMHFKPDKVPPIHEPFSPAVINFPSGTTWEFSGALQNYAPQAPIDDRMVATATIEVSGKITITPAGGP